jgi:hypothetical protein
MSRRQRHQPGSPCLQPPKTARTEGSPRTQSRLVRFRSHHPVLRPGNNVRCVRRTAIGRRLSDSAMTALSNSCSGPGLVTRSLLTRERLRPSKGLPLVRSSSRSCHFFSCVRILVRRTEVRRQSQPLLCSCKNLKGELPRIVPRLSGHSDIKSSIEIRLFATASIAANVSKAMKTHRAEHFSATPFCRMLKTSLGQWENGAAALPVKLLRSAMQAMANPDLFHIASSQARREWRQPPRRSMHRV